MPAEGAVEKRRPPPCCGWVVGCWVVVLAPKRAAPCTGWLVVVVFPNRGFVGCAGCEVWAVVLRAQKETCQLYRVLCLSRRQRTFSQQIGRPSVYAEAAGAACRPRQRHTEQPRASSQCGKNSRRAREWNAETVSVAEGEWVELVARQYKGTAPRRRQGVALCGLVPSPLLRMQRNLPRLRRRLAIDGNAGRSKAEQTQTLNASTRYLGIEPDT